MTFANYWDVLLKRWMLITVCIITIGIGTYIGSTLVKPVYQSSVLIQVAIHSSNSQSDISGLLASDQLVQTESQLATSDPVLREVASHYKDLSVEQLAKKVTSTIKLNTQLFQIDVEDTSPTQAARVANDIATTLIKQQLQITQQDNTLSQQKIQQDLNVTRQRIDAFTTQIIQLQNQGGKQSQIAVFQAQLTGLQEHYTQWQNVLAQLELTEAQGGDFLRIVQPAQPALAPVKPLVLLNTAIGLVAGVFLGIALALLFDQLDVRVRTADELAQLLSWPILGTVWRANTAKGEEIFNPQGHSANIESYRILRTNIGFSGLDKPLRFIAVTSAVSGEGKSTIAANLAIFMAKAGKSTLLIDADLRRPTVHKNFAIPAEKMGLSNATMALARIQFSLHNQPSIGTIGPFTSSGFSLKPYMHSVGLPNLLVMPSGPLPPNPPELLDSKAMNRFFKALDGCGAEIVIFDTPPLLGLSDTSILVSKMDGTLFVTDINRSNKNHIKSVKAILEKVGAGVVGIVTNKENHNRKNTEYPYHNYYRMPEHSIEQKQSTRNGYMPQLSITPSIPMTPVLQRSH